MKSRADSVRLGVVIIAVCLGLGLIEAAQLRFGTGEVAETDWWIAFWRVVPSWIILAGLSPLAIAAADRWPVRGAHWRQSLMRHMALSVPFTLTQLGLVSLWGSVRPGSLGLGFTRGLGWLVSGYFVYGMLSYGALVGVIHAFRYHREVEARRREAEELVAEVEQARRRAAEGKLHPHFVFNTLNAIMGLATRGDQQAVVRTLDAFSELLRATLDDTVLGPVPLREEIELLKRYVEIQQVRFGSRLHVAWEIEATTLDQPVPGLLLQPLVENALSHAIGRSRHGGTVTIRSGIDAGGVRLEVEDTGSGSGGAVTTETAGRGIGLDSTRARLASQFGDGARLELSPREGGGTVASIFIPAAV